jgi:integrase
MSEKLVDRANNRLKSGKVGLIIEIKRDRLCLRGTLPPKEDSKNQFPHQQRIYLSYPVSEAGIKQAERDAIAIRGSLISKTFNWSQWLKIREYTTPETTADWVQRFEQDYFDKRQRAAKSESTWRNDYLAVYRQLPQDYPLTADRMMQVVLSSQPDTRSRRRACMALSALAKFSGIELDLTSYTGNYSPSKVSARDLPSDDLILEVRDRIFNPKWQNAYTLMAAYGLRPHEIFYLDVSNFPEILVTEGKTGSRKVLPIPQEWAELIDIDTLELPNCVAKANKELGDRVCKAFRRYSIAFPPYNLRHAYAVRGTVVYSMPVPVMAKMLGHSPNVHMQTYQQWISEAQISEAYAKAIAKN